MGFAQNTLIYCKLSFHWIHRFFLSVPPIWNFPTLSYRVNYLFYSVCFGVVVFFYLSFLSNYNYKLLSARVLFIFTSATIPSIEWLLQNICTYTLMSTFCVSDTALSILPRWSHLILPTTQWGGYYHLLQMTKLRHRAIKSLAQGHTQWGREGVRTQTQALSLQGLLGSTLAFLSHCSVPFL